jgi:hypothetical protein
MFIDVKKQCNPNKIKIVLLLLFQWCFNHLYKNEITLYCYLYLFITS